MVRVTEGAAKEEEQDDGTQSSTLWLLEITNHIGSDRL